MTYFPRVMAGSCRTATDKSGQLYHAVHTDEFPSYDAALCGKTPGRKGNGWSDWKAPRVTCPKCLAKLEEVKA